MTQDSESVIQNEKTSDEEKGCKYPTQIGSIEVCFPEINGMTYIHNDPDFNEELMDFRSPEYKLLAVSVPTDFYNGFNEGDIVEYDDYFYAYSMNTLSNTFANEKSIDEVIEMYSDAFFQEDEAWDGGIERIEERFEDVNFDQPVLLEKYQLNELSVTYVLIVRKTQANGEYIFLTLTNMLVINNRLIMLTYYKSYESVEATKQTKSKNDYIIQRLFRENQ